MPLHVEPLAVTARWYAKPGGYERWEPFEACATLQWCGPDEVLIAGLRGRLNPTMRADLRAYLLSQGVKRLVYLRRGRRIVRDVI